ncbi:DUF2789 domain-containing protein [Lacimicrobium sp. SS2-24]|uniref:DUF2789 domain-containing protein n=1 Tax=Lacimicrobium sp. SS2-24 TaxID=2005569 RepID=UPI0014396AA2|nr:DUF2789 domain-containing protein [Lacimicrobium sp. SS2-24]
MNMANPSLNDLFNQLGLQDDTASINQFIDTHRGLDSRTRLEDAPFWSPAQANLLRGALQEDAEWAEVIDQLNCRLR